MGPGRRTGRDPLKQALQARILAIDDQLYFRVFLEDMLEQEGFEVATAGSGAEALERLEAARPDLVLTDLVMPGMDGRELVREVKERWPDQEIVVITSVGDVKTAVEAMKLGATDYLLKPIDRTALLRAIDAILDRLALQEERDKLVAENLSYLGHFAQYERALGLFSTLALEPLADRLVEVLCLETNAHSGVAWFTQPEESGGPLRLAGVGGLVRIEDERPALDPASLPDELAGFSEARCRSLLVPRESSREALYVALRIQDQLLGIVRLTDRLDGASFDGADREVAERFALFGSQALHNALEFRGLQRSSLRDPTTRAYTREYFQDAVHHELTKAKRFGRSLSLVRVQLDPISPLRASQSLESFTRWIQELVGETEASLRTTDLLATETDHQYLVMLPECDSLGAVVAKRRIRRAVEQSAALQGIEPAERPVVLSAMATFPANGSDLDELGACLDARIEEDRHSVVRSFELESVPFRGLLETLLAEGAEGRARLGVQMAHALLGEVGRNPHHRGLLFLAPEGGQADGLRPGLEQLRGVPLRTEVVLVADRDDQLLPGVPVTWVSPLRVGAGQPFLVYLGEGASYAFAQDGTIGEGGTTYHTADPVVVEQLAFQLSRDLGIPIGE